MNKLLEAMASDMNIQRYLRESETSFEYRVILSGLGQWCLRSAASPDEGVTKHSQTLLLNSLQEKYMDLFPETKTMFETETFSVAVFIRRVYEEIGYLFSDENNKNHIANNGKCIAIDDGNIYFGNFEPASISGLGVITNHYAPLLTDWRNILIRDKLTWDQFIANQYDIVLFEDRDISVDEVQFFNPLSHNSPSSSWENRMTTDRTIARKTPNGPFYKVMQSNNGLIFCEEPQNVNADELISFEYRRLYFALKKAYGNPLRAKIKALDDEYSELIIGGHLPNREYYLLLLCAWPYQQVFNKNKFIIKNQALALIKDVLSNLAIEIKGE